MNPVEAVSSALHDLLYLRRFHGVTSPAIRLVHTLHVSHDFPSFLQEVYNLENCLMQQFKRFDRPIPCTVPGT